MNAHLLHACKELLIAFDKAADDVYPSQIADVVKLHSKLAVASAWVPIPGADVAAGAVNIWSMYLRLNKKIGLEIGESILKSVASGVATNLASYAAVSAVGSVLKCIPGIGTAVGAVVMSASLYAITLASGLVYIETLTYLRKNGLQFSGENLTKAGTEFMKKHSHEIKNFIDEARKEYKKGI